MQKHAIIYRIAIVQKFGGVKLANRSFQSFGEEMYNS